MILFLDIETVPLEIPEDADAESIKKLSLSALTARVLCLGYALDGRDSEVATGDEVTILAHFWELARTANLFVGYNVLNFDLKFLWQRSMILGVKPSREIPFTRFRQSPIFDVMEEWSKWGRDHVSLDALARALGILSPKENGLDGSKVYEYHCAGRHAEIFEYCKDDVRAVREVYRRLTGKS